MPGMLSEAQAPAAPPAPQSSGPVSQTPPLADPGAGNSPGEGAAGSGQPPELGGEEFQKLRDEAIQLVYGDRFDQLIKMFQTNGAEKFPRSMAITINTAITELESKNGPIDPAMAAEIGMDLMIKLLEDIVAGGVVPDVTLEQVKEVLPAMLVMYADSHPDVSKQDVQQVMRDVQAGLPQGGGALAGAGPAGAGVPAPEAEAGSPAAPPAAPPPGMIPPGVV